MIGAIHFAALGLSLALVAKWALPRILSRMLSLITGLDVRAQGLRLLPPGLSKVSVTHRRGSWDLSLEDVGLGRRGDFTQRFCIGCRVAAFDFENNATSDKVENPPTPSVLTKKVLSALEWATSSKLLNHLGMFVEEASCQRQSNRLELKCLSLTKDACKEELELAWTACRLFSVYFPSAETGEAMINMSPSGVHLSHPVISTVTFDCALPTWLRGIKKALAVDHSIDIKIQNAKWVPLPGTAFKSWTCEASGLKMDAIGAFDTGVKHIRLSHIVDNFTIECSSIEASLSWCDGHSFTVEKGSVVLDQRLRPRNATVNSCIVSERHLKEFDEALLSLNMLVFATTAGKKKILRMSQMRLGNGAVDLASKLMKQIPWRRTNQLSKASESYWTVDLTDLKASQSTGLEVESKVSLFCSSVHFEGIPSGWKISFNQARCSALVQGFTKTLLEETKLLKIMRNTKGYVVIVKDAVTCHWHPLVHRAVTESLDAFNKRPQVDEVSEQLVSDIKTVIVGVHVENDLRLFAHCDTTLLSIRASEVKMTVDTGSPELCYIHMPNISCGLDQADKILTLSNVTASVKKDIATIRPEMEFRHRDTNTCVYVTLGSLAVAFPYEMDVQLMLHSKILGHFKWLKRLHGVSEEIPEGTKRLAPDIVIIAKAISVQLPDDSFEVRLRDNYELMEDEFFEAEKRKECLQRKIEELRKSHALLLNAKVDELYASLQKRNSDLFVSRAKALKSAFARRTRLLELSLTSVKLYLLADHSMNGSSFAKSFINTVDPEASIPENFLLSSYFFRWMRLESREITIQLRDYNHPLLHMTDVLMWGKILLAEQASLPKETVTQELRLGENCRTFVKRGLQSFKFYTNLVSDSTLMTMGYGPCWEPALSQVSVALDYVTGRRKTDRSPPLPWWDKLRYFMHGQGIVSTQLLKLVLHTSHDPYNTHEQMEIQSSRCCIELRNNTLLNLESSSLDLFIRTAAKYEDCQLFHVPRPKLRLRIRWRCRSGRPVNHFSVRLDGSNDGSADSYLNFRSSSASVALEVSAADLARAKDDAVHIQMFSSTFKWMESIRSLLGGTSRPIRKGRLFGNDGGMRKKNFSRHINEVEVSLSFRDIVLDYWTTVLRTKGISGKVTNELSLQSSYYQEIKVLEDGLIRRPRVRWHNRSTVLKLKGTEVWLQSAGVVQEHPVVKKKFFLSVEKVDYQRMHSSQESGFPCHQVMVQGAKCAWTIANRDLAFSLYDSWWRDQKLSEQLSYEATTSVLGKTSSSQQILPKPELLLQNKTSQPPSSTVTSPTGELSLSYLEVLTGSDIVKESLESEPSTMVLSREGRLDALSNANTSNLFHDALFHSWVVRLLHCQVLLRGGETNGYLIFCFSGAEVKKTVHRPKWRGDAALAKTSWSGNFDDLQYFATVSPHDPLAERKEQGEDEEELISWLPSPLEASFGATADEDVRFSNETVGGVVDDALRPLQRIVSRCKCEFQHITYGDLYPEDYQADGLLALSQGAESEPSAGVNSFSLLHRDLYVSTNSLQYAVILDVLNNLLLYVDPVWQSKAESYLHLKYKLMLSNAKDLKKPIMHLQHSLKQLMHQLRSQERALYQLQIENQDCSESLSDLESEVQDLKQRLRSKSDELHVHLRCFHDFQLSQNQRHSVPVDSDNSDEIWQRSKLYFSRAQWRLTETDGQLGIADIAIENFSYAKTVMRDDSVEHLLEMGHVSVKNLLKDQAYVDVLFPTQLQNAPLDHQTTLRIFCREKSPVGGISVKDHFEINVVPLSIGVTHLFYKTLIAFCFPDREGEYEQQQQSGSKKSSSHQHHSPTGSGGSGRKALSNFYVQSPLLDSDDVEQMKKRAKQNKLFTYIKIPAVPICVSFKGDRDTNKILDVSGFPLQVPTIEYHNVTWTWLDFLLAVKSRTRDSLVSQAIKQKLTLVGRKETGGGANRNNERDKAKMLLGEFRQRQS